MAWRFSTRDNLVKYVVANASAIQIVVGLVALFLILTAASLVISDPYDDIDMYIKNSENHYWEAIGDNIQLAIDDLDGYGTVWLPSDTFILSNSLVIKNNMRLIGSGIGNTIIRAADGFVATDSGVITGNRLNNVDGNRDNAPLSACCIHLQATADFTIENVYLTSPAWNGLRLTNYCDKGQIENVYATDINGNYQGLSIHQVDNCAFSDCVVWNSVDNWGMDFSQVHDCTFENLLVYDSAYGIKVIGQSLRQTERCTFTNLNMLNIAPGDGFKIQQCKYSNFNNIRIEGGFNGFYVWDTCVGLNINNVYVDGSSNIGVSIHGSSHSVNNVHVINSGFYGLDISSSYDNIVVSANQTITFVASESFDANGFIVSYQWDFGDGKMGKGFRPSHAYERPGKYTVSLVITDSKGNASSRSVDVSIVSETKGKQEFFPFYFNIMAFGFSIVILVCLIVFFRENINFFLKTHNSYFFSRRRMSNKEERMRKSNGKIKGIGNISEKKTNPKKQLAAAITNNCLNKARNNVSESDKDSVERKVDVIIHSKTKEKIDDM